MMVEERKTRINLVMVSGVIYSDPTTYQSPKTGLSSLYITLVSDAVAASSDKASATTSSSTAATGNNLFINVRISKQEHMAKFESKELVRGSYITVTGKLYTQQRKLKDSDKTTREQIIDCQYLSI